MRAINNRFVISEFNIASAYYLGKDYEDAIKISDDLPTPGETVKIKTKAQNSGFSNGRDVTLKLMIAGKQDPAASIKYPVWLAGEEKIAEFEYTVPKDADLSKESITLYYQIRSFPSTRIVLSLSDIFLDISRPPLLYLT